MSASASVPRDPESQASRRRRAMDQARAGLLALCCGCDRVIAVAEALCPHCHSYRLDRDMDATIRAVRKMRFEE